MDLRISRNLAWSNQVERVFGEVTRKCLKHRSAATVAALRQDMAQFLDRRNENAKPEVKGAWQSLHDRHGARQPAASLASIEQQGSETSHVSVSGWRVYGMPTNRQLKR